MSAVEADASTAIAAVQRALQALLRIPVAITETAEFARQRLVDLTPRDTGTTGDGWYVKPVANSDGSAALEITHPWNEIGAIHPGGPDRPAFVANDGRNNLLADLEYGTKPHKIKAQTNKGLIFKGRDGQWRNVQEVDHPGTRAHGMVAQTAVEAREFLRNRLEQLVG